MRRLMPCTFLAIVLTLIGCANKPETAGQAADPFLSKNTGIRDQGKIMAVSTVSIPDGLPDPGPVQDRFASLIHEKLREKGLFVLKPEQYTKIWKDIESERYGFLDEATGLRDDLKIALAMAQTIDRLGTDLVPDGMLVASIIVVEAPFGSGRAHWDGTSQPIKTGSLLKGFVTGSPDGTLGALSLRISVFSVDGEKVYSYRGGIEVLSKMSGSEFVLVPRNELFKDDERIRKSVDIALDPLLE
ncbi:MAG: hypothetical protein O7D32_00380 [bacterium]|nr:hypothetical protein [bacterium]